jgi:DNA polymerase I-like protein with 3'-5' exonuclease and polymerase domains
VPPKSAPFISKRDLSPKIPQPKPLLIHSNPSDWTPEPLPCLDGFDVIDFDLETNGLRWDLNDRPVGYAIAYGDRCQYIPIRHAGGNVPLDAFYRWADRELRSKRLRGLNVKFDIHMARVDAEPGISTGIDLEAQGCTATDVGHMAALLDDHRRSFSLENISQDYLKRGKVKDLQMDAMAEYHASDVAAYAEEDVRLTRDLAAVMYPQIVAQDLERVLELENSVIWTVCEMEKNGFHIDEELLARWTKDSQEHLVKCLWDVYRETGLRVEPHGDLSALFYHYKIDLTVCHCDPKGRTFHQKDVSRCQRCDGIKGTPGGGPSFDESLLKSAKAYRGIELTHLAKKIGDKRSDYLLRYLEYIHDGRLFYPMNQLRNDDGGTVSGRFSSWVQQVPKPSKQRVSFGYKKDDASHDDEIYVIRKLFKAPAGRSVLSSDAKQIEYRFFAHYANSPRILKAYADNPDTDFHNIVLEMVQAVNPEINRDHTKNINFAKVFGAGLAKISSMLSLPRDKSDIFVKAYDRAFPEVAKLLRTASKLAAHRGYVKTILGRRSRFPDKQRLHKALNCAVQGSSTGDYSKIKLVELHAERKHTGFTLRIQNHDEFVGDVPDQTSVDRVSEILARQSMDLRVPILWDTRTGPTWGDC